MLRAEPLQPIALQRQCPLQRVEKGTIVHRDNAQPSFKFAHFELCPREFEIDRPFTHDCPFDSENRLGDEFVSAPSSSSLSDAACQLLDQSRLIACRNLSKKPLATFSGLAGLLMSRSMTPKPSLVKLVNASVGKNDVES